MWKGWTRTTSANAVAVVVTAAYSIRLFCNRSLLSFTQWILHKYKYMENEGERERVVAVVFSFCCHFIVMLIIRIHSNYSIYMWTKMFDDLSRRQIFFFSFTHSFEMCVLCSNLVELYLIFFFSLIVLFMLSLLVVMLFAFIHMPHAENERRQANIKESREAKKNCLHKMVVIRVSFSMQWYICFDGIVFYIRFSSAHWFGRLLLMLMMLRRL